MTKIDYRVLINVDIDKGFTKSQLEKLIGLPKNSLTETLKGSKEFSKISKLKIDKWEASEKPDPLTIAFLAPKKGKKLLTTPVVPTHWLVPEKAFVKDSEGINVSSNFTTKPKDYNLLLKQAKEGVEDVEAFRKEVVASKCNHAQKEQIYSKLNSNT